MPSQSQIFAHKAKMPGGSVWVYHRADGPDRLPITRDKIDTLTMRAFNLDTRAQIGSTLNLDKTVVVFDTMQFHGDDPGFPEQGEVAEKGFNFRHLIPASYFAKGPQIVRIEYDAVAAGALAGEPFSWADDFPLLPKIG